MKKCLFLFLFLLINLIGFSQNSITGTIIDNESKEPIPGATIIIKELQKGVMSDIDGNYEFKNIDSGSYTLSASFVSYIPQDKNIIVSNNDNIFINQSINLVNYAGTYTGGLDMTTIDSWFDSTDYIGAAPSSSNWMNNWTTL